LGYSCQCFTAAEMIPLVNYVVDNTLPPDSSWRWTGHLTVPTTGAYDPMIQTSGGRGDLRLDGRRIARTGDFFGGSLNPTADGLANGRATVELQAARAVVVFGHNEGTEGSEGGFDVSFRVHNVGNFDGDEVAQVYLGPSSAVPGDVQMAEKALVAFTRGSLKNGEWQDVTLHVAPRWLPYWSADCYHRSATVRVV